MRPTVGHIVGRGASTSWAFTPQRFVFALAGAQSPKDRGEQIL